MSNSDMSCRMFRSDFLEAFSHVRPWIPHLIFLPIVVIAAGYGVRNLGGLATLKLYVIGVLTWTVTEYFIHRFIFHPPQWIEDDTRRIIAALQPGTPVMPEMPTWRHKFYFLVHGVHHDFPSDTTRLVMPPGVSIPLASLFLALFLIAADQGGIAIFAGFITGYLCYDTIHYVVHVRAGGLPVWRYFKKRHFSHHYADSSRNFGVSSPLWDVIMRTSRRGTDEARG